MNQKSTQSKSWFALYVKPRHEFKARDELNSVSVENYLPVITKLKQWSDRRKKIDEPLIKGYIFIYADEVERLTSLERSAVVKCICDNGRPAKIPDWQIFNLQKMLSVAGEFDVINKVIKGTKVEIVQGPFKGVQGIVENIESADKLGISIDLLNRSVIVHLSKANIIKACSY